MNTGTFAGISGGVDTSGATAFGVPVTSAVTTTVPPRVANGNTTIVRTDRGRCVRKSDTSTPTWFIATAAVSGWTGDGSVIGIFNDGGSGALTLTPESGVTLTEGTTTGSITVAAGQGRMLHEVELNVWRLR